MAVYSYDPIFATDPSNPENVASNASITIFDPADVNKNPIAITDVTGSPLPNPITVNKSGFGPAFQHPTLDRVGWSGGGFSNYFTSYEGLKNVAVEAAADAQTAAATAGAQAAAVATAAIGTATGASTAAAASAATAATNATAAATAATNAAALVGAPADAAIAAAVSGNGATKAALSATFVPLGFSSPRQPADSKNGAIDWRHEGTSAYLQHLVIGANTLPLAGAIAVGTDLGLGDGFFVSHKNTGVGFRGVANGGSSILQYMVGMSKSTLYNGEIFKDNQGMKLFAKIGAGFGDGVATSGSTTFTSATAVFTGADVGASLSQTTTKGTLNQSGTIPSGTTIVSVTNATTVVLSNAATANGTGICFLVGGRTPTATQQMFTIYDTNGTSKRYEFALGKYTGIVPHEIQSNDAAVQSLKVTAAVGQTSEILTVMKDGGASGALSVTANGTVAARFGSSLTNAGSTGSNAVSITNSGTGAHSLYITRGASQTGDQISIRDSGGALTTRIDKDGTIMTKVTTAPVDAQLTNGEVAIYFDSTNGAAKLKIKAKQADGTVRTGEVVLA